MSLLSRVTAPLATHDLAGVASALLSSMRHAAPSDAPPPASPPTPPTVPAPRPVLLAPVGLGTAAARFRPPSGGRTITGPGAPPPATPPTAPAPHPLLLGPVGLGTAAVRFPSPHAGSTATKPAAEEGPSGGLGEPGTSALQPPGRPGGGTGVPELYCPGPVRDNEALGEEVDDRLVEWAEQVGIYPGKLDQIRAAGVGRLIMLAHPDSDDPDQLLAAAKCALAEWATDDHYVDDEELGADPRLLAARLVVAHAVVDPAYLPARYAPDLERAVREDPVMVAYRSSLQNLARYASTTQMFRLRHALAIMFVAYNQEGAWRTEGRNPPAWEYLVHRNENSFIPCMVLIDVVGGYELPPGEFADQRVRRVFTMAGLASVIVNDLYSVSKEQHSDTGFNLPRLIAAEERCSLEEAVNRTAGIHDELMHTVEAEAAALSLDGSPALRRFLAGVWAWLGGGHEWHRTSPRYRASQLTG